MTKQAVTVNSKADQRRLERMEKALKNADGSLNPALNLVMVKVEGWHKKAFLDGGKRFGGWKPISMWTAILRPKPKGFKKLVTFSDAAAYASKQTPLVSTGALMKSITGRNKGHIRKILGTTIQFGTNLKYAALHYKGGTSTRSMGRREWSAFDKSISKTKDGSKAPRKSKKRRRWGGNSPWNPDYFVMKSVLKRGGSFNVPKRPFLIKKFTASEMMIMENIVKEAVEKIGRSTTRAKK